MLPNHLLRRTNTILKINTQIHSVLSHGTFFHPTIINSKYDQEGTNCGVLIELLLFCGAISQIDYDVSVSWTNNYTHYC